MSTIKSVTYAVAVKSVLFVTMLIVALIPHRVWSQSDTQQPELRIENRIPKPLLAQPEVLTDVERLKSLRRSLVKYGRKHPAYAATEKQIVEVEAKLADYIEKSEQSRGADQTPLEKNGGNRSGGQIDPASSGFQLLENSSDYSSLDFGTDFRLLPVYPSLDLPPLIAAGRFPAFGLMWGVEFDEEKKRSRIWQWSDSSTATQKRLYLELEGKVEFLFFSERFEKKPVGYFLVSSFEGERLSHISLIGKSVEQLPPFTVIERQDPTLVLKARLSGGAYLRIEELPELGGCLVVGGEFLAPAVDAEWDFRPTQHSSIWLLRSKFTDSKDTDVLSRMVMPQVESESNRTVYRASVLPGGRGMKIGFDPENGDVLRGDRFKTNENNLGGLVSKTSRGIRGCFRDSRNEPLILDDFGVLLGLESKLSVEKPTRVTQGALLSGVLPEKIRQTGWFVPNSRTGLSKAFINYHVQVPSKVVADGIDIDRYVALPESSKMVASGEGSRVGFPPGTVLLQNLSYFDRNREERYLLKTLGLIRTELEWIPFLYRWNYNQTDAVIEVGPKASANATMASSQAEVEFYDAQKRLDFGDCLRCHSGVKSVDGLGLKNALVQLDSDGVNEVLLRDFLEKTGMLKTGSRLEQAIGH